MTIVTYLVIGRTIGSMSSSWSPYWRKGRPVWRTVVSIFTWPEMTRTPIEST